MAMMLRHFECSLNHPKVGSASTWPSARAQRPLSWCFRPCGMVMGQRQRSSAPRPACRHRFAVLFDYAQVPDFTEHDLRHETTCRWYEMRAPGGGWLYRPEEINRIMGWAPNSLMALRYASFRAEDLATRMWPVDEATRAA